MKRIAFYGKGGIGKSTTVSNVAAALVYSGYKVLQIGCDPKSDSTILHNDGKRIETVLDVMRKGGGCSLQDIVHEGTNGVYCVEAGGPLPGTGCAGRGIIAAFEKLAELKVNQAYKPDFVLYDVLGDVVCGGFAMPIRNGYADGVYIITSGEMMSLYAANNIVTAVGKESRPGYARLKGLIANLKNIANETETVQKAAAEMGVKIAYVMPRSDDVQRAEAERKTVVEAFPESETAKKYTELAEIIANDR